MVFNQSPEIHNGHVGHDKGMLVYIFIVHVHQYVQCTPMYTDDRGHVCVHIYCLCTPMCTMYANVHQCTPMTESMFVYIVHQ